MARIGDQHENLDDQGIGKCSVPMWMGGSPAGFCNDPAYGERPEPDHYWIDAYTQERKRSDNKYDGYVPALACPGHGGPSTRAYMDGDAWCAVHPDFINLQESPAGFGDTPEAARTALELEPA